MEWCHIIWFLTSFFHFSLSQRSVFNLEALYTELRTYWVCYFQFYRCWKIPVRVKNGWGIQATFGNPKTSGVQPFSSVFVSSLAAVCIWGIMEWQVCPFLVDVNPLSIRTAMSSEQHELLSGFSHISLLRILYHCVASPWFMHLCVINWTLEICHSFDFVFYSLSLGKIRHCEHLHYIP